MNQSEKESGEIRLPSGADLVLSTSPHLSTGAQLHKIMGGVLLALTPAVVAAAVIFGWRALWVIGWTVFCCVVAEALWCLLAGKPVRRSIGDLSAAVTGVLLALCLPVSAPWWLPVIGAVLAIWLGKQVYGGLGHNPFNPALVARVGLLIGFPALMTAWTEPAEISRALPAPALLCPGGAKSAGPAQICREQADGDAVTGATPLCREQADGDAVTCATPLGIVGTTPKIWRRTPEAENNFFRVDTPQNWWKYFLGERGGSLGETCAPALLLGYLILVALNLINWRVPALFVGTALLIAGAVHLLAPGATPSMFFHLCTGGLLLGAVFMATDMVTSPITGTGCVVFAVGCGVVTMVIRIWGNYPEGVSFAILFMNALVPLIDRKFGLRPFGYVREKKREAAK